MESVLVVLLDAARRHGWTDYKIAQALRVSRQTISGVRNNRHGLSWLHALTLKAMAEGRVKPNGSIGARGRLDVLVPADCAKARQRFPLAPAPAPHNSARKRREKA